MLHSKASKLAIFTAGWMLSAGIASSANAQVTHAVEWSGGSVIDLGGLPGSTDKRALAINNAGQVVG